MVTLTKKKSSCGVKDKYLDLSLEFLQILLLYINFTNW